MKRREVDVWGSNPNPYTEYVISLPLRTIDYYYFFGTKEGNAQQLIIFLYSLKT